MKQRTGLCQKHIQIQIALSCKRMITFLFPVPRAWCKELGFTQQHLNPNSNCKICNFTLNRYLTSLCSNFVTCKNGIISTSLGCLRLKHSASCLSHHRYSTNFNSLWLVPKRYIDHSFYNIFLALHHYYIKHNWFQSLNSKSCKNRFT